MIDVVEKFPTPSEVIKKLQSANNTHIGSDGFAVQTLIGSGIIDGKPLKVVIRENDLLQPEETSGYTISLIRGLTAESWTINATNKTLRVYANARQGVTRLSPELSFVRPVIVGRVAELALDQDSDAIDPARSRLSSVLSGSVESLVNGFHRMTSIAS